MCIIQVFTKVEYCIERGRFMVQSRTHTCGQLRIGNAGEKVTLTGWYDNMRKVSKNLGFLILRDFYGVTQVVVETDR